MDIIDRDPTQMALAERSISLTLLQVDSLSEHWNGDLGTISTLCISHLRLLCVRFILSGWLIPHSCNCGYWWHLADTCPVLQSGRKETSLLSSISCSQEIIGLDQGPSTPNKISMLTVMGFCDLVVPVEDARLGEVGRDKSRISQEKG